MKFDEAKYAEGKEVLVSVHDVHRTFWRGEEPVHALDGITLNIYRGEYICVMGPSGSGKSTFFNAVGGLDTPTSGRVFIDERAMTTVENAVNSLEILRAQGIETMTIITSDYHQRRGQAIYNAMSALYARDYGYAPAIVGNYCYGTDADEAVFQNDVLIAARQLSQLLNLPREKHN